QLSPVGWAIVPAAVFRAAHCLLQSAIIDSSPYLRRCWMYRFIGAVIVSLAMATLGFAGGIPSHSIHGDYVEARTADVYTGPCFANAEVGLVGNLAVFGWKVNRGNWHGANLDGLSVVGVVRARH